MEDQLILTIDVGSSSVRASLYDRMGRYVNDTEVQLLYSFKTTSGDGAEMDADGLVEFVARAVDGTLSLRIAKKRAACLSEMRHQTILASREVS